jgi:hypothetical protein
MGLFSGRHHAVPTPPPASRTDELEQFLDAALTFQGVRPEDGVTVPIALKKGERMLVTISGAMLVEPKRQAGQWQGRSQGVSVHVPGTKSMRYRVGSSRGTFVQGAEVPSAIDDGQFTVTSQRAVFVGAKQTREWMWDKLISVMHHTDVAWTAIAVSNRQKTSGVAYDEVNADLIRFRLDLAVARATDTADELIGSLRAEIAALSPAPPPPPPAAGDNAPGTGPGTQ